MRRAICSGAARSSRHSSASARSASSSRSRSARRTSTRSPLQCPRSLRSKNERHGSGISELGYAAGERLGVDARISHLNVFGSARADRSAGTRLAHRARRRGGVHAERHLASRALALVAGAAPGDRRARLLCDVARRPGGGVVAVDAAARQHCVVCGDARAERRRCEPRSAPRARGRDAQCVVDRSRSSPRGGQCSCAHPVAAHRAGRRLDAGHLQLFQHRRRCAPLSPDVRRPCSALRAVSGSDRSTR